MDKRLAKYIRTYDLRPNVDDSTSSKPNVPNTDREGDKAKQRISTRESTDSDDFEEYKKKLGLNLTYGDDDLHNSLDSMQSTGELSLKHDMGYNGREKLASKEKENDEEEVYKDDFEEEESDKEKDKVNKGDKSEKEHKKLTPVIAHVSITIRVLLWYLIKRDI